ncbi:glucose-6-phosphate isomerase [Candidatus Micrarchaeota archaeon]|nr:glucose-6-phosphate isomerase [Candidatus Micrarchaeota archaeon]
MEIPNSPLKIELKDNYDLLVEGEKHRPDVRQLRQMLDVLYDQNSARQMGQYTPMYYMFRDVKRKEDSALLENSNLRYDITVLPPMKIGAEFNKTYGHYHEMATSKLSYPELYEVLQGEALYLLQQRFTIVSNEVSSVYLVHAKAGDKVIVPPNFGHITINPLQEPLVMDNLVESKFRSDYSLYRNKRGGAYYVLDNEKKKNNTYMAIPKLIEMDARAFNRIVNPLIALKLEAEPSYSLFLKDPKLFDFLKDPTQIEFKVKPV